MNATRFYTLLTALPSNVSEYLTRTLIRDIINIIWCFNETDEMLKVASSYDKGKYNSLCRNMLKSVLLPSTEAYDTTGTSSSFAQKLIIKTFDTLPN